MAGDEAEGEAAELPLFRSAQLPTLPAGQVERQKALRAGNRGLGRQAGQVNRRTALWAEHILKHYQSPLVVFAETYSRPVEDLAAQLGCTLKEAFEIQQLAADRLAPYLHGKQAVAVDLTSRGLVALSIELGTGLAAETGEIIELGGEIVENQGDGT